MKFFEKKKKTISSKSNETRPRSFKFLGLFILAVGNVSAMAVATVAWFSMNIHNSEIDMVTGDLDVDINKVTAYKYVYPYYKNSTEFINYDTDGAVKKYVLEDHVLTYGGTDVDDISITSDNATITVGAKSVGTFTQDQNAAAYNNICVPSTVAPAIYAPDFHYYLIGDDIFCGVENSWSLADSYAFSLREAVTIERPAVLDNVVVSAGSSFSLLEVTERDIGHIVYDYNYFPINSIAETNSPFRIIDNDDNGVGDTLLCLRSGIYKFTYSPSTLRIELHTRDQGTKKDISVISNNSLDPTKISIDYAGSVNKTDPEAPSYYPTIDDYMPEAIHEQNTTLVLDVELLFTNTHPVDAGLKIERTAATSNSIYNLANKYQDTTHNLVGYVDDNHQNLLRASDFYNYYAKFTATPYATANDVWAGMHRMGDADSLKFSSDETYEREVECELHTKDLSDSIIVPGTDTYNVYHCYISIEYDYEYGTYFLDKNRLGKTYLLDRDFGFHFSGTQHIEE